MSDWLESETNTHQDHVIAHVIGATVTGSFVWDETAFLLLDIGFVWNIYLNGEMGLVPCSVAIKELDADDQVKSELSHDVDVLAMGRSAALQRIEASPVDSPIQTIQFFASESSRRLLLACEDGSLVVETSLETSEVKIYELWTR